MEALTNTAKPSPLLANYESQDELFASAFAILKDAITNRAFPAASIAITHRANLIALKAFGHFIYPDDTSKKTQQDDIQKNEGASGLADVARSGIDEPASIVTPTSLFDLASLTKVVATTPMAMLLYERGLLDLDAPLAAILPEFISSAAHDPRRNEVTLRMLLAHSSGLPAYEKLFLKAKARDEMLEALFALPLTADPGTNAAYSDIGFILLGIALERLADERLDRFCQREVFAPLSMTNTTFNPPASLRNRISPTADERGVAGSARPADLQTLASGSQSIGRDPSPRSTFRNGIVQGQVQDENAYVLGGVAAHAGLFSTAEDLTKFAITMLKCGADTSEPKPYPLSSVSAQEPELPQLFRPETVHLFTRRESAPLGTSRALGWDTPSVPSQSGKHFSPNSYGHLGYTGTSLWIDPTRQLSIALLTNRTWPDSSNQAIKQIRPKFHDAVIEAIGS